MHGSAKEGSATDTIAPSRRRVASRCRGQCGGWHRGGRQCNGRRLGSAAARRVAGSSAASSDGRQHGGRRRGGWISGDRLSNGQQCGVRQREERNRRIHEEGPHVSNIATVAGAGAADLSEHGRAGDATAGGVGKRVASGEAA